VVASITYRPHRLSFGLECSSSVVDLQDLHSPFWQEMSTVSHGTLGGVFKHISGSIQELEMWQTLKLRTQLVNLYAVAARQASRLTMPRFHPCTELAHRIAVSLCLILV